MGPTPTTPALQAPPPTRKLSGMMALMYAVQGAWWPLLAVHLRDLGITGRPIGWIFATAAMASLATPLVAGQVADRFLSAQKLIAIVFAMGSGLLAVLASGIVTGPSTLFAIFLAYWLISAPGFALANTLALRNLPRPSEQFGAVRLWGTVGWMGVGWAVSGLMLASGSSWSGRGAYEAFWVAAALSAAFAIYCLTLPDTPPLAVGPRARDWGGAFAAARKPAVAIYLVTAFGVSLTTPFQYQVIPQYFEHLGLGRSWLATAMTLGQVAEIAGLAVLPAMLGRLGVKGSLALGIAALVVRHGSLAAGVPLWAALAGMPLHGVGVACFSVAGQVFLDDQAPIDRRAGAQSLNTAITGGVGSLLGNILAGEVGGRLGGGNALVFLSPFAINATLLIGFLIAFRPEAEGSRQPLVAEAVP